MVDHSPTLEELHRQGRTLLADIAPENAAQEAFWLFEAVFGMGRPELLRDGKAPAPPEAAARYRALLDRRAAGEPLQYLLGQWEFFGLPMLVGPGVLIPRPETEELVELVLAHLSPTQNPEVLDLCSGTGCIPIAIASRRPDARCRGVELSPIAMEYFVKNCGLNQTKNVTPVLGDVFALPGGVMAGRYHAITANPPYITAEEMATLQREVQQEPSMALLGGKDGLDFYRKIPTTAAGLLLSGGLLAMEIGESQGEAVAALTRSAGFTAVTVHRDLSGNPRMVTGLLL